jgi:hypothetical protein
MRNNIEFKLEKSMKRLQLSLPAAYGGSRRNSLPSISLALTIGFIHQKKKSKSNKTIVIIPVNTATVRVTICPRLGS